MGVLIIYYLSPYYKEIFNWCAHYMSALITKKIFMGVLESAIIIKENI